MRYLSGIQPSGLPHLGNYFGAIRQHIDIAGKVPGTKDTAFYFIADYHALTSTKDAKLLDQNVRSVAATYLALGLPTQDNNVVFFRQSYVPEVCELSWLLSSVTGMGLLERAVSYKDKVANGLTPNVGLFTYPILQAADIAIYDSDVVPVGADQVQHIEMTQDIVKHFNATYKGKFLLSPNWQLSPTPKLLGVDGKKMSKSYNNAIWIFDEGKNLKKSINAIVTDSSSVEEPKDPEKLLVYQILQVFLNDSERQDWSTRIRAGGVGYGHIKSAIVDKMDLYFGEARERYRFLTTTSEGEDEIDEVLVKGAITARKVAQTTLFRCLEAVGLHRAVSRSCI